MNTNAPNPVFLMKVYDDAMALIVEARNYIAHRQAADVAELSPEARLLVSQETLRVTSRLTQAMAWLLFQRAVMAE